jgi:K+-sensing histidine kinase KdpD
MYGPAAFRKRVVRGLRKSLSRAIPHIPHGRQSFWRGQLLALALVLLALICRALIDPLLERGLYFAFLFPAILVAGIWAGTWSAITTAVVGGIATDFVWMPPRLSFTLSRTGIVQLAAFWLSSSLLVFLTAFIHSVLEELAASESRAKIIASELQHRVQNCLTVVQAIALQTLAGSNEGGKKLFIERLAAMGRAQALVGETIYWGEDRDRALDQSGLSSVRCSPFHVERTLAHA